MPSSRILIASQTLSSAGAVSFSSIPQTYKDLVIRCSARSNDSTTFDTFVVATGAINIDYTYTQLRGNGSSVTSVRATGGNNMEGWDTTPAAAATSNTFGSFEIYIPNYAATVIKQISMFAVGETNATTANMSVGAFRSNQTNAITFLSINAAVGSFIAGSSFYLYGIKNS